MRNAKQRWARRRAAERYAYGRLEPEVRDELRKLALGSLCPLVRTSEQAAMSALVLAATSLLGLSEFVPMSGTAATWSHERLALLGWWGSSSFALQRGCSCEGSTTSKWIAAS